VSRNLGLITGASVMGAVFAFASATADITTAPPEAVATGMRITFAVAALLIVAALAIRALLAKERRGTRSAAATAAGSTLRHHKDYRKTKGTGNNCRLCRSNTDQSS